MASNKSDSVRWGALAGAVASLLVALISAVFSAHLARAEALRQDRIDAYSEYLGNVGSCSVERESVVTTTLLDNLAAPGGAVSQNNVRALLDSFLSCTASLRTHEARIRLVGTDEVADTARELTTATAKLVTVDPTVDKAEYDEAYRRFLITSAKFEVLARDDATDHFLGRLLDPLALTVGIVTSIITFGLSWWLVARIRTAVASRASPRRRLGQPGQEIEGQMWCCLRLPTKPSGLS